MSLDQTAEFVKRQTATQDAFLGGKLSILQPKSGFRAGLDSVLLGASISPDATSLLDMGSGVGVAALTALAHNSSCKATLVESNEPMAELAIANIAHNGFDARASVIALDVTATGKVRTAAGLKSNYYQSIIANPPFFDAAAGTRSPQNQRAAARHMGAEALDSWVRTGAASAAAGGEIIFIYRADGLPQLLVALEARFGNITILPIVPRPGEDANRVLVRAIKGSRAPMVLKSAFVVHGVSGHDFSAQAGNIFRGQARLHW